MRRHATLTGLATATLLASSCLLWPGAPGKMPESGFYEGEITDKQAAEASFVIARDMQREGINDLAVQHYLNARRLDSSRKDISANLAVLYDRMGLTSQAQLEYERALREHPRSSALHNDYGYFLYVRGRHAESEVQFRKALELDAKNDRARINLGLALARLRRDQEALEAFRGVVTEAQAYSNLAMIQTQRGDYDLAEQNFERALALDPLLQPAAQAMLWLEDYRAGRVTAPLYDDQVPPGEPAPPS